MIKCCESSLRGFFRQDEGEKPQEYFVYFKVLRQNHGGKRPQDAEVAFDQRLPKDYTDGRWGEYMSKNEALNSQIQTIIDGYAQNIQAGSSVYVELQTSIIIDSGESIIGYQYLHGTVESVGGFQMKGYIHKDYDNNVHYSLTCTWNDLIDPNYNYDSDAAKVAFAKDILHANPKDYRISITWSISG